ncbi:PxKF domain-containing protein [Pseudarthrobacter sp. H2]|uniref:PxKF domain-containing protein n=1 Tax=Pseudarthrobacter sp. H2 TaxID=3418415 RepID=UPI003CF85482
MGRRRDLCPAGPPLRRGRRRRSRGGEPVRVVPDDARAGSLGFDPAAQTYNDVWKTEASWAGTCRTFDMTLNDGSSHQAMFRFVR